MALVSTAAVPALLEESLSEAFTRVNGWMSDHGLAIAAEKTEVIVLTKKRVHNRVAVVCNGHKIRSQQCIKYLGVHIDAKMGYAMHAELASRRAATALRQLSHLMPNLRGPRQKTRRLLASVVLSRLLYGAKIWADFMLKGGVNKMEKI